MVRKRRAPLRVQWLKDSSNLFQNTPTLFVMWLLAWAQNGLQTTGLVLQRQPMRCVCVIQTYVYVTAIGKPLPLKFCRTKKTINDKSTVTSMFAQTLIPFFDSGTLFFATFRVCVSMAIKQPAILFPQFANFQVSNRIKDMVLFVCIIKALIYIVYI